MPTTRVIEYLDSHHIPYSTLEHSRSVTADQFAAATHVPLKQVAKTVIIKVDGRMAEAVLPASRDVDLEMLEVLLEADRVRLAGEAEFRRKFPDCDPGAMPPFGNLYQMPVYVDESLSQAEEIAFDGGSHETAIRLAFTDFQRSVNPRVLRFSTVRRPRAANKSDRAAH